MEAKIVLSYRGERDAEAVANAVSPDNVRVPQGLLIKTVRRGNEVVTYVKCETKLLTFISTIDDLLSSVSVAEKTISSVRETRKVK